MFLIPARFVGKIPVHLAGVVEDGYAYLGKRGHWRAAEKALRFKTRAAAEAAIDEKWVCLRSAGDRSIIPGIVQLKAVSQSF